MRDMGDGQRAKARALMPEVARIVKPVQPAMGPRAMVTAPGTTRNFKNGGAAHSDVKQDKAMVRQMVKPTALKKADGGAARARSMAYGTDAGTKVNHMASGGAAARAHAAPGSSTGTKVVRMKTGGKCMADGGVAKGSPVRSAGTPKSAPRVVSGGMKPASLAAGGVAKLRRGVATPAGKPAPLPKGGKIPVNMGPRSKAGR